MAQSVDTARALSEIGRHIAASRAVLDAVAQDRAFQDSLVAIAGIWVETLDRGGKILLAGNGGSAGDAQHIAGELLSRLNFDRPALAGIALTTDTSVLTAIGNDYGYEKVFERQVIGLGREGDCFTAISTSGNSPNIVRALSAARDRGLKTVGLTGSGGGAMAALCDVCLRVPSASTPLIQQVHITVAHAICGLVEDTLFATGAGEDRSTSAATVGA